MKVIVYINFILTLIIIVFLVWFVVFKSEPNKTVYVNNGNQGENITKYVDQCGDECKKEIDNLVSKRISTISGTVNEQVKIINVTPVPSKSRNQTTYIPIIGPITTTSTDWYDAPGTDFYLNAADYGKDSYFTWEASLKVAHGNGVAFARLFDVTHGIAVNGSEVSVTNKSDLTEIYSGSLSFWSGNNLYRVQIKSLNSYIVTFGNGRLKVMY